MKFGFRTPSLRKRVSARTSPARFLRPSLGLKAPRGWGWLTNPKRAAYNRIYNRTTVGCLLPVLVLFLVLLVAGLALAGETRVTNAKGQLVGRKDASGRIYDAKGRYRGREDEQGRMYDAKGRYRGRTKAILIFGKHSR